jgi:hypothetical protein
MESAHPITNGIRIHKNHPIQVFQIMLSVRRLPISQRSLHLVEIDNSEEYHVPLLIYRNLQASSQILSNSFDFILLTLPPAIFGSLWKKALGRDMLWDRKPHIRQGPTGKLSLIDCPKARQWQL